MNARYGKMRVGTLQLFKVGIQSLKYLEHEEYFCLYDYQDILKPFLDEYYCTEDEVERFRNQSYRILEILEAEGKVVRLCGARVNNPRYVAVGGEKVVEEADSEECELHELTLFIEEQEYSEKLNFKIIEIHNQIMAHTELMERFPAHSQYLRDAVDKLESEARFIGYKKEILDKIIDE